ncbi:MAG: alkaline phosphatase family protein [Candidatus Eisenbacteria bacterium]
MWFKKKPRVVVIGLDGTPLSFLKRKLAEGSLPALKKIFDKGSLIELNSVHPCVSCVAWSSMMTGKNPGKHNIYGFIDRKPGTYQIYLPNSATMTSTTLWEMLSEKGRSVIVMNVPVTYPPRAVNGYLVSGFDAPRIGGATYPDTLAPRLKTQGYEIDIDPWRARENLDNLYPDLVRVFEARVGAFFNLYKEKKWDFAILHIMETDRLYHFMWEYMEQGHPKYAKEFMEFFGEIDKFFAKLEGELEDDVTLMVMSDHGFCTLKREIYLNKFLEDRGYLAYKPGDAKSLADTDPARTRAYTLDPGRIFINLKGREAEGCVSRAAYPALRDELRAALLALTDEQGNKVVKDVYTKDQIYSGPNFEAAADLIVDPVNGYDPKGAFGKKALSGKGPIVGMHTYDDAMLFVKGHGLKAEGASVMDVAPTILQIMDIEPPSDFDGKSLIAEAARIA